MTRVSKIALPANSLLLSDKKFDYTDSYQASFLPAQSLITPADLGKAFFSASPAWVDRLFSFRNKLVSFLGLKVPSTANRQQRIDQFKGTVGETAGLFRVFAGKEDELIIGEDDKHLDFRVSLLLSDSTDVAEKNLAITTIVNFHNRMGRLYFLLVKPFHRLIVPAMLKAMIKKLGAPV